MPTDPTVTAGTNAACGHPGCGGGDGAYPPDEAVLPPDRVDFGVVRRAARDGHLAAAALTAADRVLPTDVQHALAVSGRHDEALSRTRGLTCAALSQLVDRAATPAQQTRLARHATTPARLLDLLARRDGKLTRDEVAAVPQRAITAHTVDEITADASAAATRDAVAKLAARGETLHAHTVRRLLDRRDVDGPVRLIVAAHAARHGIPVDADTALPRTNGPVRRGRANRASNRGDPLDKLATNAADELAWRVPQLRDALVDAALDPDGSEHIQREHLAELTLPRGAAERVVDNSLNMRALIAVAAHPDTDADVAAAAWKRARESAAPSQRRRFDAIGDAAALRRDDPDDRDDRDRLVAAAAARSTRLRSVGLPDPAGWRAEAACDPRVSEPLRATIASGLLPHRVDRVDGYRRAVADDVAAAHPTLADTAFARHDLLADDRVHDTRDDPRLPARPSDPEGGSTELAPLIRELLGHGGKTHQTTTAAATLLSNLAGDLPDAAHWPDALRLLDANRDTGLATTVAELADLTRTI